MAPPDPNPLDGGWYANALGIRVAARLADSPAVDLRTAVADAISDVADTASLAPGRSPSSTIAVVRWPSDHCDALVLGDIPVIVQTTIGIDQLRDDRLVAVATADCHTYRTALRQGGGYGPRHQDHLRALVTAERARRNRAGGYWIA